MFVFHVNLVDCHVLVQLCSLLEGLVAGGTWEWLVAGVGSQVVHHVALLVKFLAAAVEATEQD
jgi:hypothetical protein